MLPYRAPSQLVLKKPLWTLNCCTQPHSLRSLQGLLELITSEGVYCSRSKATISPSLIFNCKAGSNHESATSKIHWHRTRRRQKVLGKGGGHHPPPPWVASATDEAAGGKAGMQPWRSPCHGHAGLFSHRAAAPQKFMHRHKLGTGQSGCNGTHTNM